MTRERFVADGHDRARRAIEPAIRAEVERECADQLRAAGGLRRLLLRWRIAREISRRVAQKAPPDADYFHDQHSH